MRCAALWLQLVPQPPIACLRHLQSYMSCVCLLVCSLTTSCCRHWLQVTACDPETKAVVEAAGGSVTRVYYEEEGLKALLHVSGGGVRGAAQDTRERGCRVCLLVGSALGAVRCAASELLQGSQCLSYAPAVF